MSKIIYLNGNKINIRTFNQYVSEGAEAKVYKFGNKALKIYHNHELDNLTKEDCLYLTNIKTKRTLLPKDVLSDQKNNFCGYTTTFLIQGNYTELYNLDVTTFIDNILMLYDDAETLAQNSVKIDDINLFFTENNKLYSIDPGFYKICKENNLQEKNDLSLQSSILNMFKKFFFHTKLYPKADNYFNDFPKKKEPFLFELKNTLMYYETLGEFITDLKEELKNDEYLK